MLDFDLALLYNVENKRLKEAVRRNVNRFPDDFMFELTKIEYDSLRSQIASLKNGRGQHLKYLPFVKCLVCIKRWLLLARYKYCLLLYQK